MKKRWEIVLALFILVLPIALAVPILEVKIDFYRNGNVFLKTSKVGEGSPTQLKNPAGDIYSIQLLDENGAVIYEQKIVPVYPPGASSTSVFFSLPIEEKAETVVLRKGSRIHIRKSIHTLLCNKDEICESWENPTNCPEDCAGLPQKCNSNPDEICDPSCPLDPDCQTKKPSSKAYIIIIAALIIFGSIGYVIYKYITGKRKPNLGAQLAQQLGIPYPVQGDKPESPVKPPSQPPQ